MKAVFPHLPFKFQPVMLVGAFIRGSHVFHHHAEDFFVHWPRLAVVILFRESGYEATPALAAVLMSDL
jgi:hypothetical protein